MNDFNERLKQAMQLKKITQSELCERTGIPKSAMSQYVSGAFAPKQERTFLIAKALDVNESWLLGYDDVPMERSADSSNSKNDSYSHDIRRIERVRKLMPPEKWNSMMKTVEAAFSEYFNDDYVDDDLDE